MGGDVGAAEGDTVATSIVDPVLQVVGPEACCSSVLFISPIPGVASEGGRAEPAAGEPAGPEVCLGIDEAGRGPAMGALVYGAAYWALDDDAQMCKAGFDDSKALGEVRRAQLFQKLVKTNGVGYVLRVIGSQELSAQMLRSPPCSLNTISHNAAIEMIRELLDRGVRIKRAYIDTVGDPKGYKLKLDSAFKGTDIEFTVEPKADSTYKVVSAASICAKVVRDAIVTGWQWNEPRLADKLDRLYGSGYPSDEKCSSWLNRHLEPIFGYPDFVRFSWAPVKDRLEEKGAKVDWEEEEEEGAAGTAKMHNFLMNPKKRRRSNFFHRSNLELLHHSDEF